MTQYHVTLNGQGYVLDLERYQKRPRAPFVSRQGSGAVSLVDLRGPEQQLRITDWSGGEGQVQHDAAGSRYRSGVGIDTSSVPGGLQLGPLATLIQTTAENSLFALIPFQGQLHIAGGVTIYRWNGSVWSTAPAFGFPITGMELYLNRLYTGQSLSGVVLRYDGATYVSVGSGAGPTNVLQTHYRQAGQFLYCAAYNAGLNGVARIYYNDGAVMSAGQFDPEETTPATAFVMNQRCYFAIADTANQRWGLYSVDDATAGGNWRMHRRLSGGYPSSAAVLNGVAYLGDAVAGRIYAWDESDLVVIRELSRVGVPYPGNLAGLAVWRGALWAGVIESGSTLSLLRYDGKAWSRPVTGLTGTDVAALGVFTDQLYVGTVQTGAAKLYRVRADQFAASGNLVSGLIDAGLPGTSKLLRSVTIVTSAIASPQSVQVEYQLEDTGAWTSLGTLSAVGATTATYGFPASTTCRQVAFRVTLAGTAGAPTSPILYELVLRYVPRPAVQREWELAVLLEGTAELPLVTLDGAAEPLTGVQLTQLLWTAAAASGTVTYVDLDGTSYQVYVDDLREEVGKIGQRRGYQRVGLVRLVEAA